MLRSKGLRRLPPLFLSAALLFASGCGDESTTVPDTHNNGGGDNALPLTVRANPVQALCVGQPQTLSAIVSGGTAPYTWSWSAEPACNGCISDPTAANPAVTPTTPTTFHLTLRDAAGKTVKAQVPVDVKALPSVSAGAEQTIDPGAGAALQASPAITGETSTWSCNRDDCALADPTAASPYATPVRSTRYTVTRTNAAGCSAVSETTVWVNLQAQRTIPEDGEMAWPVNAKLLVQFDQPLDPATVTSERVSLVDEGSGAQIPVTTAFSGDGRTLYVIPGSGYFSGGDYVLTLSAGVQSLDAVLPNILPAAVVVAFSTTDADVTPPSLTYRLPPANGTNIALNTSVVASFDEQLDPASVDENSVRLSNATGDVAGALSWDPAARTIFLRPSAYLNVNEAYTVNLDGLADLAGNTLTTSWSFTTGSELDTRAPEVVSVNPAAGEVGVSATSTVVVAFSELIDSRLLSGFTITRSSDGQPVPGTVTFNPARFEATWSPAGLLESLTNYTVTVSGISDLAGNLMVSPFVSTFTTRQVLFSDDFNSGTAKWTLNGAWGSSARRYHSAGFSLADSPLGKYAPNTYSFAQMAQPIDVSGMTSVSVQYWLRGQSEKKADFYGVYYRLDGGDWIQVRNRAGNVSWIKDDFVIDPAGASMLDLKFSFESDGRRERDGIYVDDFIIQTP